MRRDCHGRVTRDNRVTSQVRVTCDKRDVSRVSHATTTTPHHTISSVQVVCGVSGTDRIRSNGDLQAIGFGAKP